MDCGPRDLIRSTDWHFAKTAVTRAFAVLLCLTVHKARRGLAALSGSGMEPNVSYEAVSRALWSFIELCR